MRCVPAQGFSVAKALAWRSSINDDPPYQRPGDVWSLGRRQRFIDSLINGYDVPKVYVHDLRGIELTRVYAVVDGKQRLTAIWDFLGDRFALAADFRLERGVDGHDEEASSFADDGPGGVSGTPAPGRRFSELAPAWRTALLRTQLSVVLIQDASEIDIEELFSRLNSGVPLSPGERWQAIGGDTMEIAHEITRQPAFAELAPFPDRHAAHAELALRLVAWAAAERDAALDRLAADPDEIEAFVRAGRGLDPAAGRNLLERTTRLVTRAAQLLGPSPRGLDDAAAAFARVREALTIARRRAELRLVESGPG